MPKRIIVTSVHVQREGKVVVAKPGELFEFTADELADIKRLNPRAVRAPVMEDTQEPTEADLQRAAAEQAANEAKAKQEALDRAAKAAADAAKATAAAKNAPKGSSSAADL